jgi:uncharacterized protein
VNLAEWEIQFAEWLERDGIADPAHDLLHVRRVLSVARQLAALEGADLSIVVPAAWLHDCVNIPKSDPRAPSASRFAADKAVSWLRDAGYPEAYLGGIYHAIEAHSYSARVVAVSVEARVMQDADRLDALGAIGIARCFMVGGALRRQLYAVEDPFAERRDADDQRYTIDHFFKKLFRLPETMQTSSGRQEALRRAEFMRVYLQEFRREIRGPLEGADAG